MVQVREATQDTSLLQVRSVCTPHGPSLHVDGELRRTQESQVFPQLWLLHGTFMPVLGYSLHSWRSLVRLREWFLKKLLRARLYKPGEILLAGDRHFLRGNARPASLCLLHVPDRQLVAPDQAESLLH